VEAFGPTQISHFAIKKKKRKREIKIQAINIKTLRLNLAPIIIFLNQSFLSLLKMCITLQI
jgi:hypothetical protein